MFRPTSHHPKSDHRHSLRLIGAVAFGGCNVAGGTLQRVAYDERDAEANVTANSAAIFKIDNGEAAVTYRSLYVQLAQPETLRPSVTR